MRIAFYSDNFYPELSGITDTIIITGKELTKRGHSVLYVAPRYSPTDFAKAGREFPKTPEQDLVEGMPIVRIPSIPMRPSPTGQSRLAFPTGASFAKLEAFKPDIIHTQSPYATGWEAVRASKRLRVPLIGTNHTAIEDFFPPGVRVVMRRYDAYYYNHCQFISAPYARLIERMREVGFKREGKAVENPAELDSFTPATDAVDKEEHKKGLGLSGPVALYSGRLGVEKRVDVVVRAAALVIKKRPDFNLIMTGRGAAEQSLKKLGAQLGIEKNLRFTGFLSRKALPEVYKASDMFAFMSTSDSQSLALMQGYAAGLPAICARARGLPDYTPESCGFLIEPGDYKGVAEKMEILIADTALRENMSKAAIEYSKGFSPAHIADKWEEIYKSHLSNPL